MVGNFGGPSKKVIVFYFDNFFHHVYYCESPIEWQNKKGVSQT